MTLPTSLDNLWVVVGAATLATLAGLLVAAWPRRPTIDEWLRSRAQHRSSASPSAKWYGRGRWHRTLLRLGGSVDRRLPRAARSSLSRLLTRATINAAPEIVVSLTLLLTVVVAGTMVTLAVDSLVPASLSVLSVAAVPLLVVARIAQLAAQRRRAIADQLPLLVDLMALEQGGGGVGPRTAIELVVSRLNGEAAMVLRECLTASAMTGTPQLDQQLEAAAESLAIPALSALAAVVRVQREEGVSVTSPLGQLASGLRDRQRDEMLSRGRRALVTMLLPVALCILLPFVIIILYPALARLSSAFS
ncbi:MAG: hypothetical protein ACRENX_03960 [Candidatus Dormibacteria bacterium]